MKVSVMKELTRLANDSYDRSPVIKHALINIAMTVNEGLECSTAQLTQGEKTVVLLVDSGKWTEFTKCQMIAYFNSCK